MEAKKESKNGNGSIAAVRIRGLTQVNGGVESTMRMLRLYKNNYCSIIPSNPVYAGMLKKAKDYITWGELEEDTLKLLIEKRGEEFKSKETEKQAEKNGKEPNSGFFKVNNKKIRKYFRLNAPRKGFGRKGIKQPFQSGGSLGYRGLAINDLIKRMV